MLRFDFITWLFLIAVTTAAIGQVPTAHQAIDESSVDTLVVCPAEFQPALKNWLEYRQRQGHKIKIIAPVSDENLLKSQIRTIAADSQLQFLFLIGDTDSTIEVAGRWRRSHRANGQHPEEANHLREFKAIEKRANPLAIPMPYIRATANVHFGSETWLPTDNVYADLDDDGLPDLAVGRIPVQSIQETQQYLDRVIAHEVHRKQDEQWRRRINFVAGVGGFGPAIDNVLEQFTKEFLTHLIPHEYETSMTLGSWSSPYCPDPRQFGETVVSRFNEGCQFWIYIGHGAPTELDHLRLPDDELPTLNRHMASQVDCSSGSPIAIFLACYTGAIDHDEDSLTETLLQQPQGPVAIISGTRMTMPYGMSVLMLEFADEYFKGDVQTLGELLQTGKRNMITQASDFDEPSSFLDNDDEPKADFLRKLVHGAGKALSPRPESLADERQEHVALMNLFGDPLLRLARPKNIEVLTAEAAESGSTITITGTSPIAGHLCVDLAYPRDRFRKRPPFRKSYVSTDEQFLSYQQAYQSAHDLTCANCVELIGAGKFQLTLDIPSDANGHCVVRCMISSEEGFALGSTTLTVHVPSAQSVK